MKVDINIITKNREPYLYGLLLSLKYQTHKNFDVYILDDGSQVPLQNNHYIMTFIQRLKFEGHRVELIRNDRSMGIVKARQKLVEHSIENGTGEAILRLDDDTFLEDNYVEKLVDVLAQGYDIASGITPPAGNPLMERDIDFVVPVINRVVLDKEGNFVINSDDCGHSYYNNKVLIADHFRSAALIKKYVHELVKYEEVFTNCGFREEQFFSFRAIMNGFKIGVDTGAIMWHCLAPSGGDRKQEYQNLAIENQKMLNRFTQKWFKDCGDFIEHYHQFNKVQETEKQKMSNLTKSSNLIFTRDL
jgi:GT2 family glycosyltransferase